MVREKIELEDHMVAFGIVDDTYDLLKERIEEFNTSKGWLECALDVSFRAQTGRIVKVFDELFEEPLIDIINDVYNDSYIHVGPTLDKWLGGE